MRSNWEDEQAYRIEKKHSIVTFSGMRSNWEDKQACRIRKKDMMVTFWGMHQAWRRFRKRLRWNLEELGPRRRWSHEDLKQKGWHKNKKGELVTQEGFFLAPWGSQVKCMIWKDKIMTFEMMLQLKDTLAPSTWI